MTSVHERIKESIGYEEGDYVLLRRDAYTDHSFTPCIVLPLSPIAKRKNTEGPYVDAYLTLESYRGEVMQCVLSSRVECKLTEEQYNQEIMERM